jgi:signal transduction histidine kinase
LAARSNRKKPARTGRTILRRIATPISSRRAVAPSTPAPAVSDGRDSRDDPAEAGSPSAAAPRSQGRSASRHRKLSLRVSRALPRTFQGRLSLAFVLVFVLAVGIVSVLTVYVLNDDLRQQETTNLAARANAVAQVVKSDAETAALDNPAEASVISANGVLNSLVVAAIGKPDKLANYANTVAQADLRLRFGTEPAGSGTFVPASPVSTFSAPLTAEPGSGQARDTVVSYTQVFEFSDGTPWYLEVSLSAPYTTRSSTIASLIAFLLFTAAGAIVLAVLVASVLARRFTTPLRRLTEAARALADGDLSRRVPADRARTGGTEITELSRQFNAMADQVEETMEVIRRDRDTSREFLADVSHELRTPLAALRTFNELLREKAGDDVAARTEFLESSAQQIERLDWLAQNLLELSKLDSGLIRLDLRPDDLRGTILSAVEQAQVSAQRRGISLTAELPETPLVTRHDPQRLGQVLSNLIGNALKFTPRGGSVRVLLSPHHRGARIQVVDTGVGIDARELPQIFDRFYRGSRANEARGSGSGLGLAIVRSVVEMHGGRVMVESRVGAGSTFTVSLPADPRTSAGAVATGAVSAVPGAPAGAGAGGAGGAAGAAGAGASSLNPDGGNGRSQPSKTAPPAAAAPQAAGAPSEDGTKTQGRTR